MKIYFPTRSAMRSFKSGKAQDNGTRTSKRWSRELENPVNAVDKRKTEIYSKGNFVSVVVKKSKV